MKDQLNALLQKRWTLPTATGVVGLGVGTLVGYMFTRKQYDRIEAELARVETETFDIEQAAEKFEQYQLDFKDAAIDAEVERRVTKEIEKRMSHILGSKGLGYATESEPDDAEAIQAIREDHPSARGRVISSAPARQIGPETVIGRTVDIRETGHGIEAEVEPTEEGRRVIHNLRETQRRDVERLNVHNIFGNGADEWDYKTEIEHRDKTKPYIIHVDEYMGDEMGWDSQSTLTWYEKDQILTDSQDHPIHNPSVVVGLPLRFGHGSNDPNVVYVRNEQLQAEYEILRDSGSYQEIVLGEEMEAAAEAEELRHSHQMRFRGD